MFSTVVIPALIQWTQRVLKDLKRNPPLAFVRRRPEALYTFRSLLIKEIDRCPLVILSFEASLATRKRSPGRRGVIIGARLGGPLKVCWWRR